MKRNREWTKKRKIMYILPETQERIKKFGIMGDTYGDVIDNILDFVSERKEEYWKFRNKSDNNA